MEDKEQKNVDDLWKELLDIINKQLEVNARLKDIVEDFTEASSPETAPNLSEEMVNKVRDLFVEGESLQAEQRAIYHKLLGTEE